MCYSGNCTACSLFRWGVTAHFFLALNNMLFYGDIILFIQSAIEEHLIASKFWQLWISFCKHSCTGFCVDTSFQFIWENTRNVIAGSYGKRMFSFVRNCLTIPKWLYYFAFSPAVTESSFCFISSPAFDIISVLDFEHSKTCVVVSRCFNHWRLLTWKWNQICVPARSIWKQCGPLKGVEAELEEEKLVMKLETKRTLA